MTKVSYVKLSKTLSSSRYSALDKEETFSYTEILRYIGKIIFEFFYVTQGKKIYIFFFYQNDAAEIFNRN